MDPGDIREGPQEVFLLISIISDHLSKTKAQTIAHLFLSSVSRGAAPLPKRGRRGALQPPRPGWGYPQRGRAPAGDCQPGTALRVLRSVLEAEGR